MHVILFDDPHRDRLLPLAYTRPVCDFRIGILTIREKWERALNASSSTLTQDYLQAKYPLRTESDNWFINGGACPAPGLLEELKRLPSNTWLIKEGIPLAYKGGDNELDVVRKVCSGHELPEHVQESEAEFTHIDRPWDIFVHNGVELERDYDILTKGRESARLSSTNQAIGDRIFLEQGARVECAILNSTTGSIYIGAEAEVMEGSVIRGGLALLDHAVLKLGSKIYGPTTLGPHVKAGGEISNSMLFGYSNKGHDGFLGNSVLGEWCNLGADTNTSNLKNNYSEVRSWSYAENGFVATGRQFLGLIMGDHSKSGINTMFNTGTVVGVSANVFGGGFPDKHIPSFSWGGADGFQTFRFEKALEVAARMMERRKVVLDDTEHALLETVFRATEAHRSA